MSMTGSISKSGVLSGSERKLRMSALGSSGFRRNQDLRNDSWGPLRVEAGRRKLGKSLERRAC